MSIQQAGVYKVTLYEDKAMSIAYDASGQVEIYLISTSGQTIELDSDENKPTFRNIAQPAANNVAINDYTISFEYEGINSAPENIEAVEAITKSIYGWIPLIEFMDGSKKIILKPFFISSVSDIDSKNSHTIPVTMKPRAFTFEKLTTAI